MTAFLGNPEASGRLLSLASSGTLQGAYLLSGPKSVGKATLAALLARYSVCLGSRDTSCSCRQCLAGTGGPDIVSVAPNASGNILSSMLEPASALFTGTSPTGSRCRTLVVGCADRIHGTASDDLLKLLESMLPGNLALFVSSEPSRLPETLRSRLQEVQFRSLAKEDTAAVLKSLGHRGKLFDELARNAQDLSLGLLANPATYEGASKISEKIHKALGKLDLSRLLVLAENVPPGDPALATLELLHLRMCDHMLVRMGAHADTTFGADDEEPDAWSEDRTLPVREILAGAITRMKRGAPGKGELSWALMACAAKLVQAKQNSLLLAPVKKC